MGRVLLERTKKYLFIPYEEGTVDQKIQIRDKSKKEFSFYYPIASSHVSGWGRIELPIEMVGETVEIITERDAMIEAIYTREQCYGLVASDGTMDTFSYSFWKDTECKILISRW